MLVSTVFFREELLFAVCQHIYIPARWNLVHLPHKVAGVRREPSHASLAENLLHLPREGAGVEIDSLKVVVRSSTHRTCVNDAEFRVLLAGQRAEMSLATAP